MIPWDAIGLDIGENGEFRLLVHGSVAATARGLPDGSLHVAAAPDAPEWAPDLVEEALRERLRLVSADAAFRVTPTGASGRTRSPDDG